MAVASTANLALLGKVTGVSGNVFSAIQMAKGWWPGLLSGIVFAGGVWKLGWGVEEGGRDLAVAGYAVAGLIVGLGAKLSNGCTSGHGVCGLPRLSPRSLLAISLFMASGIATATLNSSLHLFHQSDSLPALSNLGARLAIALPIATVLGWIGYDLEAGKAARKGVSFGVGVLFGAGLVVSGMAER